MKSTIAFVCQECGYDTVAWLGKCPECGQWNSFKEIRLNKSPSSSRAVSLRSQSGSFANAQSAPLTLDKITSEEKERLSTGFFEFDGVLGGSASSSRGETGGIVPGSVVLLAGDPGVGKSTLLLQSAISISNKSPEKTVLYISAEESMEQIKLRAMRITKETSLKNFLVVSLTNTDSVVALIEEMKPSLVIVDSIQTMESENVAGFSGSVGQIRYATAQFVKVAKGLKIPMILVGHVTKEGMVAGPMVLSHMVDAVLFLEGDKYSKSRILRSFKNRFGSIDEVGVFAMGEKGILEIKSPEQLFLSKNGNKTLPGSVLIVTLEGSRAFLVEVQALVVVSKFPMPKRVASGIDSRRLELLLAVLQKHTQLPLSSMDVFVNIAGGLKISDPASDLGICLAIFSSFKNIALSKTVGIAEVGLLGELREVPYVEKRLKEAKKLGFTKIITPSNFKTLKDVFGSIK